MTSTAVPSTDPADLLLNAQAIDRFANSTAPTFTDRLGSSRKTLKGIDADAATQVSALITAKGASADSQIASLITTKGSSADTQIAALIAAKDASINTAAGGVLTQATAQAVAASGSAAAASTHATNAAASAAAANSSASAADGSANSAATSANSSADSAADAAAAASATGIVAIYATKAAADAAVGSVSAGAYVEVVADEARSGARTRYVKSGGALVFALELDPPRVMAQLYVDNVAALRASTPPTKKCTVHLAGYYAPGDGGGGTLLWIPASTKSDNGGTVFRPASNPANGRYERNADCLPARWFGARSDGSDAAPAIQAAVNAVSATGGDVDIDNGEFCLGSKIVVKCSADLPAAGSGSEIHFTKTNPVSLVSSGMATLKATSAMDAMVEYIYDTTDSDLAPFYSRVEGLGFDWNGLASACLKSNYCMHMTVKRNRFKGDIGISYTGYGVADIVSNVFKCHKGISAIDGGGDSHIRHNDFYFLADGDVAVYLAGYAGNTEIGANTFSAEYSTGSFTAVHLDNSAQPTHPMHAVRVLSNEFYNCLGVKAVGNATGMRNVHGITVAFNHTTGRGRLVDATYCTTLHITGNYGNDYLYGPVATVPVTLESCSYTRIDNNAFGNLQHQAVVANNCLHTEVESNTFVNFGTTGTSEKCIDLTGTTFNTKVSNNHVVQDSASYGQNFVVESGSANSTFYYDNQCNSNVGVPVTLISVSSRDLTSHFKTTSSSVEIAPPGAKHVFMRPGGTTTAAQFSYVANAVNYPVFNPTAAGVGWVDLAAAGADATIDIRAFPRGPNGRLWIGGKASYLAASPGAFAANRVLEVKDANGVMLYIPAMAGAAW